LISFILFANKIVAVSRTLSQWPHGHVYFPEASSTIGSSAPDKQAKNTKTVTVSINKSGISREFGVYGSRDPILLQFLAQLKAIRSAT
tara:strand:- start:243 stop:506 length:264 start_codon:yes stop_codon:yes gene_type:complete